MTDTEQREGWQGPQAAPETVSSVTPARPTSHPANRQAGLQGSR